MRSLEPYTSRLENVIDRLPRLDRILLVPPDITRQESFSGEIANHMYHYILTKNPGAEVHVIPALGKHDPMEGPQIQEMFGDIPPGCFRDHNCRDTQELRFLGTIPERKIAGLSGGRVSYPLDVFVNQILFQGYNAILPIGQVVPHEVAGVANHLKNVLIGLGSVMTRTPDALSFIDGTHWMGAVCNMEEIMGKTENPVRRTFDYAGEMLKQALGETPITYVMTVVNEGQIAGLYIGDREEFSQAAKQSQELNIRPLKEPLERVVVYADENEFSSTWVANKAIYRTRMAIAKGGELYVIAPGLKRFGESDLDDKLIREHGYKGTDLIKAAVERSRELQENLGIAAHLIHSSSEGRFTITYIPGHMTQEEIEGVGYKYGDLSKLGEAGFMPLDFNPKTSYLRDIPEGPYTAKDRKPTFFVPKPGQGLWTARN